MSYAVVDQSGYENENILEANTIQTIVIKKLVEGLKEILTEANWEFGAGNKNSETGDKGYIKLVAMDVKQTSLVHLKLYGEKFESYRCDKTVVCGVNMDYLHKLIKTLLNNDILTIFLRKNDENKLGFLIENSEKNLVSEKRINLIDSSQEGVQIPTQKFDQLITMPSSDFHKVIRDMSSIADKVEIKYTNKQLFFHCKGEFGEDTTRFGEHNGLQFQKGGIDSSDIIQAYYNLKDLQLFTKCYDLSTNVRLYMKNNYPLIIEYKVGSLGELKLCIAPQVTDNDYYE